ncbi:MAG: OmpH family outer membrane protein [Crocinitomicaceae bacterium]|nr:OmpH family outer membrane protein [Crocinitomicaceae bacterium]
MKLTKGLAIVAMSALVFSCGEKKKVEKDTTPNVGVVNSNGLKIAYYSQDSLATNFDYYVEMDSLMKKKQLSFQAELQKREKALQNYVATNEQRAKSGSLSGFELQSIQEEAQRKQYSLMQYQETEGAKLERETGELLGVIGKKIEEAGRKYSEKHGIDMLIMHGAGGQFVYVTPKMDVTAQFIEYLNQHQSEIEADMGVKKKK